MQKMTVIAKEIKELLSQATAKNKVDDELKKYLDYNDRILYLQCDKTILVGCIGIQLLENNRLEIKHIATKKAYRHKRIGSTMIDYILNAYAPFWKITYKYEGIDYVVIVTAAKKDKIEMDGSRPLSQEDATVENKMKKNGRYGLLASLLFFLINVFDILPDSTGPFLATFVLAGIGVWIYFAIKRHSFLSSNKKHLQTNLHDYPEYMSLLKQYPE